MNTEHSQFMLSKLQDLLADNKVFKQDSVQTLWSDYGEIARFYSPLMAQSYICKVVLTQANSQHPRGWNSSLSHQRKLSSYANEQSFYQSLSAVTKPQCRVPKHYFSGQDEGVIWTVMEDLDGVGFPMRYTVQDMSFKKLHGVVVSCLSWLANFHASMLQQNISKQWPVGTYWHLATRPDEWASMPNSALKTAASEIDRVLNQAQFQTLVHGDAKLANFCFASPKTTAAFDGPFGVAAVDFQYCGRGVGIKDVVYFLGSVLDDTGLTEHSKAYVDTYFDLFSKALSLSSGGMQNAVVQNADVQNKNLNSIINEWRYLEVFAWADFERFITGWFPQHQKLTSYSAQQTEKALSRLSRE